MRITRLFPIFLFLLLLSGCYNYTQGESNICEVHQLKMKKVVVPVEYGYAAYNTQCDIDFPHGTNTENAGCVVRPIKSCLTYRCKECRQHWVKGNCEKE